jgi:hypothetical protein
VVNKGKQISTTEIQRAPSRHREFQFRTPPRAGTKEKARC